MKYVKYEFLPTINSAELQESEADKSTTEVIGDSICPCCGYRTIPNKGDALGYICPVCFWEIDLFINSDDEASESNHGLTLIEARENYKKFGAVTKQLKEYCREPKDTEII